MRLVADASQETSPAAFSHGDINTKNVLIGDGGIGLIDFSWLPRLRHADVAHFGIRIDYEPGVPRSWARELSAALIDGAQ